MVGAVDTMNLGALSVNRRGSGSKQYPPRMMLALLIYSYAQGIFASRRIERSTYRDVAVRYLTGDALPDHDTICMLRRENGKAIREAFVEVLRLAREMKLLKVGIISVYGTHIKANASKHERVRYDRAGELEQLLRKDVEELLVFREARCLIADKQAPVGRRMAEIGRPLSASAEASVRQAPRVFDFALELMDGTSERGYYHEGWSTNVFSPSRFRDGPNGYAGKGRGDRV
jgi:transposase